MTKYSDDDKKGRTSVVLSTDDTTLKDYLDIDPETVNPELRNKVLSFNDQRPCQYEISLKGNIDSNGKLNAMSFNLTRPAFEFVERNGVVRDEGVGVALDISKVKSDLLALLHSSNKVIFGSKPYMPPHYIPQASNRFECVMLDTPRIFQSLEHPKTNKDGKE